MSRALVWLRASRPLAQANIALPLLFGQALAYAQAGAFGVHLCALGLLWGVLDQLFIVYANDYADRDADTEVRTPFSGGSGVLVDGSLAPRALGAAAVVAALLLGLLSLVVALAFSRPLTLVAWAAALALLGAYSFRPLRLSYRGGGEVLQAVGVGWVLPWLGFYLQTGDAGGFPRSALGPLFLLGFAGNVLTALPDLEADRAAKKRTWAVRFGGLAARRASVALLVLATGLAALASPADDAGASAWPFLIPLAPLVPALPQLRADAPSTPSRTVRFVFLGGAAQSLVLLAWAFALLR